ncbi:Golgi snap receptor complex member [Vairimorpha necatrix]|uniref:Golgi snap receptor complex member n=1 Tax=Vairimorpha necatrix TaxID=6039 RepID=A0AAX4J9T1_9MICR
MIINRTAEYKKLNTLPHRGQCVSVSNIRSNIDEISKNIKLLNIKQDKLKLPSFESKSKKILEIQKMSELIKTRFKEIETSIIEIDTGNIDLNKFVINYFSTKLKTVLLDYKQVIQNDRSNLETYTGLKDNIKNNNINFYELDTLTVENKEVAEIQKNILEITNVILEMKILMHLGSSSIDRLDLIYDETNMNIEKVNKELRIMKKNYKGIKDKIMYFLGILVIILSISSIIKMELRKNKSK